MEKVREVEKVIPLFESSEVREQAKVPEWEEMVVVDEKMKALVERAEQVAPLNFSVLLTGETGVGKEELAKFIHKKSGREIFVSVNCAALPENLVESELFGHKKGAFTNAIDYYKGKFLIANNGTLFLDEIGDMGLSVQAKMLQITDNNNFGGKHDFYPVGSETKVSSDFRLICASNQNLEKLVEAGKFRQDLFFRLNVFTFHIPPLRERRTEIPVLAQMFLEKTRSKLGNSQLFFSAESLNFLSGLNWPGNVRELQNLIIEVAVLIEKDRKVIETEDFKELICERDGLIAVTEGFLPGVETLKDYKEKIYAEALAFYGGNIAKAAKSLGICSRTLYRVRKELPISLAGKKHSDVCPKKENVAKTDRIAEKEKTWLPPADFSLEKDAKKNEVSTSPMSKSKKRFDKQFLVKALEQNNWNQTKTAKALRIARFTMWKKIKELGILPPSGFWKTSRKNG